MKCSTRFRARAVKRADDGIGMILVIGMGLIATLLIMVSFAIANSSISSSRTHNRFDAALTAAESGIDTALARAQAADDSTGSDSYLTPTSSSTECAAPAPSVPLATEGVSASAAADAIAAVGGSCLHSAISGQYVFFKIAGRKTVYAKGWSPSFGAPKVQSRTVKAEYLFVPWRPQDAILTGGNLELDSSTTITTAAGSAPNLAGVHANGVITTLGNPSVTGNVTSTGTSSASSSNFTGPLNPGGAVVASAAEPIPSKTATQVYLSNYANYPTNWYDLCLDGKVRRPSFDGPCGTGLLVGDFSDGSIFGNGWTWSAASGGAAPIWHISKDMNVPGVYFAYGSDVVGGVGQGSISNMTVIAAANGAGCGASVGGNITWKLFDINAPTMSSTFMFADHDLTTAANFSAGSASGGTVISGMFFAGDQINMQTSSNGAYGSVIAADRCPGPANVIKNPAIYYDPNAQTPFTGIINTTLWLEFPNH